jgi:hypothetical protein
MMIWHLHIAQSLSSMMVLSRGLFYWYPLETVTHLRWCATLFRALRTVGISWRWDAEEGHGDPSLTCTFLVSTPAGAAVLGL